MQKNFVCAEDESDGAKLVGRKVIYCMWRTHIHLTPRIESMDLNMSNKKINFVNLSTWIG